MTFSGFELADELQMLRDLVRRFVAEQLRPAEAAQKTLDDWSRLLPDGSVPPGNDLYAIEDEDSGERVGDLWLAERDNDVGEKTLFVYSIEITPQYRGRVLGGNEVARSLYRSLGYAERAVFMSKDL